MTTINTRYNRERPAGLSFSGETPHTQSRTKQSFKDEVNIHSILKRYNKTGVLVDPSSVNQGRFPQYGDFANGSEYMSVQNRIAMAHQQFELLPSDLRRKFDNDPSQLLDFLGNPENLEEAQKLGLVKTPEPVFEAPDSSPESVSEPTSTPDPETNPTPPVEATTAPEGA